jgi:WD40 repeat protein
VRALAIGALAGEEVIVSGSWDGSVRVWAADGGPRGDPLQGHTGWVRALAIGALAGEEVIVSGSWDGSVRVWAADGESAPILLGGDIYAVDIAGSLIVVGGTAGLACLEITAEGRR